MPSARSRPRSASTGVAATGGRADERSEQESAGRASPDGGALDLARRVGRGRAASRPARCPSTACGVTMEVMGRPDQTRPCRDHSAVANPTRSRQALMNKRLLDKCEHTVYTIHVARQRSTADLHIRLPPKELRAWKAAARRSEETLTEWMRAQLNSVAASSAASAAPVDPERAL